ncbi:MAG TPA: hypothetical protein VM659_06565 [Dongiaceae bacterium]|nr:hypothetical protein [Dongiaceae bacterium]
MLKNQFDGSASSSQKSRLDLEMLVRFGCAGLNFVIAWGYLIMRWPMIGIVFGWVPAIVAAVIGFFAMDILLGALG